MNDDSLFENAYIKLFQWIKQNNYYGYDPYDGMNYEFFIKKRRNRWVGFFWVQFNKICPINFRSFFGIRPTVGIYGISLIAQALLKRQIDNSDDEIKNLLSYVYSKSLKNTYGKHVFSAFDFCISYSYFPGIIEYYTPDIPTLIGSCECANAFLDYYNKFGEYKNVIIDVKDFMLNKMLVNNKSTHIKYWTTTPSEIIIYNASAVGFSYLIRLNRTIQDPKILELSKKFFDFLVSQQKTDGTWDYAENLKTGLKRIQIDFHQGFILDSLYDFIKYTKQSDSKYFKSLHNGAQFYREKQFFNDGRCKYRWPRTWPVDIHNQSQGIITFSKLSEINKEYLEFAKTIARWTIDNMQDEAGYFYYQKWPLFTNKIPYMRWNQAVMMLALATLLETMKNERI